MTDEKPRAYDERIDTVSRLYLGGIHTPIIYFASICGRKGLEHLYEWAPSKNIEQIAETKWRIKNHLLKNYDLDKTGLCVLSMPHVTSIIEFRNKFPQSNLYASLWHTKNMSSHSGCIKGKNEYTECGLETKVKFIEELIWYPSRDLGDYYSKDRLPLLDAVNKLGKLYLRPTNKFL